MDAGSGDDTQLFESDFGDEMDRYVVLTDKNNNRFEIRVERINGSIFLTKGLAALRDFYDINLGAWFTLVYNYIYQIENLRNVRIMCIHGQLYVAISKATSRDILNILINDQDGEDTDVTSKVVYRKDFRNV